MSKIVNFVLPGINAMGAKNVNKCNDNDIVPDEYALEHNLPHVVALNNMKALVATDGTDKPLTAYKYDYIRRAPATRIYMARWDGKPEYGIISASGEELVPNILTMIDLPINNIVLISDGNKYGVIDIGTMQVVMPEYDEIFVEPDKYVIFRKGNQGGYVDSKGQFINYVFADSKNYMGDNDFLYSDSCPD